MDEETAWPRQGSDGGGRDAAGTCESRRRRRDEGSRHRVIPGDEEDGPRKTVAPSRLLSSDVLDG